MSIDTLSAEPAQVYEPVAAKINQDLILDGMQAYLAYIRLPLEQRNLLQHTDHSRLRVGVSGYELKDHTDQDNKHIFHMAQGLEDAFRERRDLPLDVRQFFEITREIHHELNSAGQIALAQWQDEERVPDLLSNHFPPNGHHAHHTRFLAYRGGDGKLAAAHYDKSVATIAVAESHNGLRIGQGPDDLTLVERSEFQPIMFPGFGWHQLTEQLGVTPRRRAAWHDVVDTGEQVDDEVTRWAVVHFLNTTTRYLDSTTEQTHTPIPWRDIGGLAVRADQQSFLAAS